ncbi:hypothetical protein MACA111363_11195 [Macrococcoides canis]|uniref:Uncharacterized protein n=1 Tax=Macrococcoides canis TaxID=1855823 RepID=A0A1W7ACL0_9STAP|nr:hypothetical protein [Macrococcus canis]ARQ07301.1 hypothetical protein MCCS_16640 [Macrococcus canis]
MFEMLATSIFGGSVLISSTLLFKMLNGNKKLSQPDFPVLENEIADLKLEYERAKKFRVLSHERDTLKKKINEIYEEPKPLDTSDFINKIEENRKNLYLNLSTKREIREGNIKAYYKKEIDDFIKMREEFPGYHYLKLPVDEHDTTGSIIREVINTYNNVKEYSYTVDSIMCGSKGIETKALCALEVYISGGRVCESQRSII